MGEEKLIELLQRADKCAGAHPDAETCDLADIVRRRARSRRVKRIGISTAAAAVILAGIGVWAVAGMLNIRNDKQIAALQAKVTELAAQMESSQELVKELVQREREHKRLMELERQLASIPDPLQEIARENDRTAFIMVYSADKLYRELNLSGSAVETYNRVIELFPAKK